MKLLAFDVGGTLIKYAVIGSGGCIEEQHSVANDFAGIDEYLECLKTIYSKYSGSVYGVCLSVPGILDSKTGYVYSGGSLDYINEMNFTDMLKKMLGGVPVSIENDGKCAAIAEMKNGVFQGVQNGVLVGLGTAIAGCLIIDGKIHKGSHYSSGEFSHIISRSEFVNPDLYGLVRWWRVNGVHTLYNKLEKAYGMESGSIDGFSFFDYVNRSDTVALYILHQYCRELAIEICNLQYIIDPDLFGITGGISREAMLLSVLREEVDNVTKNYDPTVRIPSPHILQCKYYGEANLIGAYYHFLDTYSSEI